MRAARLNPRTMGPAQRGPWRKRIPPPLSGPLKLQASLFALTLPFALAAGPSVHPSVGQQATATQPAASCAASPALESYAMTFDAMRSQVVIFGGGAPGGTLSADTWGWDGQTWTCVAPAAATGPSPRSASMLAYDAARQVIVLYGGRVGRDGLRDTWELGATGWSRKSATGPTPDPHGVMAYDATTQAVLLYHSLGDDGPGRATWKWTGTEWTRVATEPAQQFPNAMFASNGSRPALLMTARSTGKPDAFDAPIYEWRKSQWKLLPTTGDVPIFSPQAPAARTIAGALLYAGFESGGAVTTYVLNGTVWRKHPGASPPRRRGAQMVFDARRGVAVLHGGDDGQRVLSDTWEWNGQEWRKVM